MSFLITGCGRSGTKYMATVLRSVGLDVGHEQMGRDGAVSGIWAVDSDSYPKFHQQGPRPHFDLILHQVRHPLHTIGSVTTGSQAAWEFNSRFVPINLEESVLIRSAKYWFYWNRMVEAQAVFTYRIENLREVWPHLMELLGHAADYEQITHFSQAMNSRKHREVTWEAMEKEVPVWLVRAIKVLGRFYGYKIK